MSQEVGSGGELSWGLPWGRTRVSRVCQGTAMEDDSLDLMAVGVWGHCEPAPFLMVPHSFLQLLTSSHSQP